MIHPKDRTLSNAERAQIIGFHRQGASVLEICGVMELRPETVEEIYQTYFGERLAKNETP